MHWIKRILTEYKIPLLLAVTQWFITTILQVDRAFFTYDNETKYYVTIKILYMLFLLIIWCFGFTAAKKIIKQDSEYRRGFQIFCFYFAIMLVLLLILWPGTWAWDDLHTLNGIQGYESFNPWQHIITGIYQDLMLQILPFPGGIIFLQNVIISICVAFVVTKLEKVFAIKIIKNFLMDIFLKVIPFLLPPVLMYQFSGYRMGLYVYLELVMLTILICFNKENMGLKWHYIILFCFLTVIVSTWRTESFFYIPCVCILILFIKKSVLSIVRKIVCILVIVIGFLGVNTLQKQALGDSNYQIISLLRPCAELVRIADCQKDAEELAAIDRVTDLGVIYSNPTLDGETLYWNTECVRNRNANPDDDYTKEDYNNYVKAFIKLSLKYPKIVIKERWNLFVMGSGLTGLTFRNVEGAAGLFEPNNGNVVAGLMQEKGWLASTPVFKHLRMSTIYMLGGNRFNVIRRLVWNAIIPIVLLLYAWIKMLIQRDWYMWFVCSSVVVKIPIVILTQPSSWLMYLLSFYLLGYTFIVYKVWINFSRKKVEEKGTL